jgi:hypothetical protein
MKNLKDVKTLFFPSPSRATEAKQDPFLALRKFLRTLRSPENDLTPSQIVEQLFNPPDTLNEAAAEVINNMFTSPDPDVFDGNVNVQSTLEYFLSFIHPTSKDDKKRGGLGGAEPPNPWQS